MEAATHHQMDTRQNTSIHQETEGSRSQKTTALEYQVLKKCQEKHLYLKSKYNKGFI